jgi:hypothetical protein
MTIVLAVEVEEMNAQVTLSVTPAGHVSVVIAPDSLR